MEDPKRKKLLDNLNAHQRVLAKIDEIFDWRAIQLEQLDKVTRLKLKIAVLGEQTKIAEDALRRKLIGELNRQAEGEANVRSSSN